jgi:hypothetical protein
MNWVLDRRLDHCSDDELIELVHCLGINLEGNTDLLSPFVRRHYEARLAAALAEIETRHDQLTIFDALREQIAASAQVPDVSSEHREGLAF